MEHNLSTPISLLRELRQRGILVRVAPPDLQVRGPVDDELRRRLKAAKTELISFLETGSPYPCKACGRYAFPKPTTCYWCSEAERMDVKA